MAKGTRLRASPALLASRNNSKTHSQTMYTRWNESAKS